MSTVLDRIETRIPVRLWRLWGIVVAPLRLWDWTHNGGAWCWTSPGVRGSFRYRLGCAWVMVRARYFGGF